ncbi:hypothetical protein A0H81_09572 [Grifola frondosa]|uniref:Uncharacterized protein n=1 Tax=Grifola frondosa TaxID=5627 RepID=A0A1C7M1Y2_GRIFR|nr:hypothetical protein A0H81_09572 [Grifola frondosa]
MTHSIPLSPAALSTKKRKLAEEGDYAGQSKLPRSTKPAVKHGLRIVTASTALERPKSPSVDSFLSDSDADSLFDECLPEPQTDTDDGSACRTVGPLVNDGETLVPARLTTPSVPGLFFDPTSLLPEDFAEDLMWTCIRAFFKDGAVNQVMLFERAAEGPSSEPRTPPPSVPPRPTLHALRASPAVPPP